MIDMSNLIDFLSIGIFLTALSMNGLKRLESYVKAYFLNSLFLSLLICVVAIFNKEMHLLFAGILNFLTKCVLITLCETFENIEIADEEKANLERLKSKVDKILGRSLKVRQVDAGSCNACEWECVALTNPFYDIQRYGIDFVASPRHADMLLVTGPISRQMELALIKTYEATPTPEIVIACGDCTIDGGIFRDSYAVTNGVNKVIPVDFYIKGCPPSPEDIINGFLKILNFLK